MNDERRLNMKRLLLAALMVALATPLAAQSRNVAARVSYAPVDIEVPDSLADLARTKGTAPEHAQRIIVEFLELSEVQVDAWELLIEESRADSDPRQQRAEEIQAELEILFETGDPDPAVVGELVIERRAIGEELVMIHRHYVDEFEHAILTEDQHRQYHLVRAADRVQPLLPAFRVMGLLHRR